jgi:chorismate--pyruvate lyase
MKNWKSPVLAGGQDTRLAGKLNPALPSDPHLRLWLQADGSLTSRLRAHGVVQVQVQQQGVMPLWQQEQTDLQAPSGYVREVVLLLNDTPVVWARSATPLPAIQGAWRAMRGLGSRPLAELLFAGRQVEREPLQARHLCRCGLQANHIQRQWQALEPQTVDAATPRWARSSVFWRHGQPLRVMEAFSPWVRTLTLA